MPAPRVLVLYNEPTLPPGHPDADSETDILVASDVVSRILQHAGLSVFRLGIVDRADQLVEGLAKYQPDVVFNLYEGTAQWGNAEAYVAGLLELSRVPYTGSPPQALMLARSKPLSKAVFRGSGLPTAEYFAVETSTCPANTLGWPVIVKPAREDASVGIDQKSVCTNQDELNNRVRYITEKYGPGVLVERLIIGRELHAAVIEFEGKLQVLPLTEILFPPRPEEPNTWPIVTFDAKWHEHSADFIATPYKNPADVTPELFAAISDVAVKAFTMTACQDYVRVDLRVDETNQPYILEVNPNPCIAPLAGVAESLASAQIPYPEFILGMIRNALKRGPKPELAEAVVSPAVSVVLPHFSPEAIPETAEAQLRISGTLRPAMFSEYQQQGIPLLLEGSNIAVVLSRGEATLGFAWATMADKAEGKYVLSNVQTSPEHRQQGCGRALLDFLATELAAKGGRWLTAEASTGPDQTAYRRLLSRAGFNQIGELADYHKDDYSLLLYARPLFLRPGATNTPKRD